MDIKNILVATDFSNEAYNALFYATRIFATQRCTFHIINVYDDLTSATNTRNVLFIGKKELSRLQKISQEKLTETVHKITLDTSNNLHQFNTISSKGTITSVLSQNIDNLQIDLIVVGNQGITNAKKLFMGSNTIRIANTITQCPILAIPKEISYEPIDAIAFVTDFKKGCTKTTLSALLYIASAVNASIAVLHINEESTLSSDQISNKKLLKLCLANRPHSFDDIWNYSDKANVIQDYVSKGNIKMLAMAYHRKNFFKRILHEPVIMDLSIYATIPFLILPLHD